MSLAGLPDDPRALAAWVAAREAKVPGLRPQMAAQVIAGDAVTPLALVYVHGFSAGPRELSPVPERVAEALGANLYLARLRGHGGDGAALAAATLAEWREDVREALEIGARLGRRVVAIGNSTGATLLALALARGAELAGVALLAPNFGIGRGWRPRLLEAPFARAWLPWVVGRDRGFAAINADHAAHWTLSYPSVAVVPVAQAVRAARAVDCGRIEVPAFFAFSERDEVVDPAATHRVMARWGGRVMHREMVLGPGDDARGHLIAGDVFSPGQTDGLVAALVAWARPLAD